MARLVVVAAELQLSLELKMRRLCLALRQIELRRDVALAVSAAAELVSLTPVESLVSSIYCKELDSECCSCILSYRHAMLRHPLRLA